MQLSSLLFAVLPALALAQEASTTTYTSTTKLTKTVTLSRVHTVTAYHQNTTTSHMSVGTASRYTALPTTTGPSPSHVTGNAGSALDASNVAMAGIAGMIVVAMM